MSRNEAFDDGSLGYRGRHTAPGPNDVEQDASKATFDDPRDMMPDVHEHPEYYEFMQPSSQGRESVQQLRAARGKPDYQVRIYRAVPHGINHINTGDWVTSSRKYAEQHALSELPEDDAKVLSATAKAKHLYNEGILHEWGYQGPRQRGA